MLGFPVTYPRYAVTPPVPGFSGDLEHTALYAGESVRLIDSILPAGDVVRRLVAETDAALARLRA